MRRGDRHTRRFDERATLGAGRPASFAHEARELVERARAFERRGAVREATVAYDMAIAIAEDAPTAPLHADLLRWKGALLFDVGETTAAASIVQRALEHAQSIRYASGTARAQTLLARIHQRRGELVAARRAYDDASVGAVAAGDQLLFACIEQCLGMLAAARGDLDDAVQRVRLSARAIRDSGNERALAWALTNAARLSVQRRRYDDAETAVTEGLALASRLGDVALEGPLQALRAEVLLATGRASESDVSVERALAIADVRSDRLGRSAALRLRAVREALDGAASAAAETLADAIALADAAEDRLFAARLLVELGDLWSRRNDAHRARSAWTRARDAYARLEMPWESSALQERLDLHG